MESAAVLDDDSKHLHIDERRRRFDVGAKYGGHGGRSLVRSQPRNCLEWVKGLNDAHLTIERPIDEEGNALVTSIDEHLEIRPEAEDLKEGVHAFPAGRIFALAELLESASIAKKEHPDTNCPDIILTTYTVPGIGWIAKAPEEQRRLERERKARLSLAVQEGRKVFCTFRDTPLEKIPDESLLDDARLRGAGGSWSGNPDRACVFAERPDCCFIAESADSCLEVDLGGTCTVTWVSTQGRFPPTDGKCEETGMRKVKTGDPTLQNWVSQYELSFRVESGHTWVSVGTLKGNSDMTTEVAHELAQVCKAPLQCRYLRFRPVAHNRLPAMRVGVYGQRAGLRQTPTAKDVEVVKYTIRQRRSGNLRRVPYAGRCGAGCANCSKSRGGCRMDPKTGPKGRRLRMVAALASEKRDIAADGVGPADDDALRAIDEDAELAVTETAATGAPPTYAGLGAGLGEAGLVRAQSTASSSSASGSAVLVPCAEACTADSETDEWLVVR